MEKKEIAKVIKKDITRNPELYKAVYEYFNGIQLSDDEKILLELFKKLNNTEKEYYITDIKLRILKKELEQ